MAANSHMKISDTFELSGDKREFQTIQLKINEALMR